MSPPRPTTSAVASRRTALGGALAGLVALSACDTDTSSSGGPAIGASTGATVRTGTTDDPDAALVDQVASRILGTLGTVLDVRSASRRLRPTLTPLVRLHEAHLSELDAGRQKPQTGSPTGGTDIAGVRAAESQLQRQLTDASVGAESGALAEALASMAAAVAQHLAVLP